MTISAAGLTLFITRSLPDYFEVASKLIQSRLKLAAARNLTLFRARGGGGGGGAGAGGGGGGGVFNAGMWVSRLERAFMLSWESISAGGATPHIVLASLP